MVRACYCPLPNLKALETSVIQSVSQCYVMPAAEYMSEDIQYHYPAIIANIHFVCFVSFRGSVEGRRNGYENVRTNYCCSSDQCSKAGELQSERCSEQGSVHKPANVHPRRSKF